MQQHTKIITDLTKQPIANLFYDEHNLYGLIQLHMVQSIKYGLILLTRVDQSNCTWFNPNHQRINPFTCEAALMLQNVYLNAYKWQPSLKHVHT